MINHYKVLGAHASMDDRQIKELYRQQARKHHPDRGGNAEQFAAVTAAWSALRTPVLRAGWATLAAFTAPVCDGCGGFGYIVKMQGFTASTSSPCARCGGCGYDLPKDASPRSYRRKK